MSKTAEEWVQEEEADECPYKPAPSLPMPAEPYTRNPRIGKPPCKRFEEGLFNTLGKSESPPDDQDGNKMREV